MGFVFTLRAVSIIFDIAYNNKSIVKKPIRITSSIISAKIVKTFSGNKQTTIKPAIRTIVIAKTRISPAVSSPIKVMKFSLNVFFFIIYKSCDALFVAIASVAWQSLNKKGIATVALLLRNDKYGDIR